MYFCIKIIMKLQRLSKNIKQNIKVNIFYVFIILCMRTMYILSVNETILIFNNLSFSDFTVYKIIKRKND